MARHDNPVTAARGLALLTGPEMPEQLEYLWGWFCELSAGRGEGMSGAAPLTYASIDAWSRLTDTAIAPHEVRAIFELDVVTRNPSFGVEKE